MGLIQNILLIHPALPYPPKNGADQALLSHIFAAARCFNVFLCYPVTDTNDHLENQILFEKKYPNVRTFPFFANRDIVKQPFPIKVWWSISRIVEKFLHYNEHLHPQIPEEKYLNWIANFQPKDNDFLEHINRLIVENNIDVVQVEMPEYLSCVLNLPFNVKKIFVHHELAFVRHGLEVDIPRSNYYIQGIYKQSKLIEVGLLNKYDGVITLSKIDRQKLVSVGVVAPVYSSFASVEVSPSKNRTLSDGLTLSFIGTSDHAPNYWGVKWFLDTCWESLLHKDIRYRLQIIGKWPEVIREEFLNKYRNICFTGFVSDTKQFLQGTIMIVPILVGSGIRMKILEGATLGVPIVTTSIGVEGIEIKDGVHCSIADSPELFVERICELSDQTLQHRYVDNFREFVAENYSIERLCDDRKTIYNEILGH